MFEGGLHPSLKWERHLLQVTPEHLGRRQLKRRGNRFLCTAYMWAVHSDFFFLIRDVKVMMTLHNEKSLSMTGVRF